MDTSTGQLVTGKAYDKMTAEAQEEFDEVPKALSLSAKLELMGKDSTVVGKQATSQIALWSRSKEDRVRLKAKKRRMNKLHCQ